MRHLPTPERKTKKIMCSAVVQRFTREYKQRSSERSQSNGRWRRKNVQNKTRKKNRRHLVLIRHSMRRAPIKVGACHPCRTEGRWLKNMTKCCHLRHAQHKASTTMPGKKGEREKDRICSFLVFFSVFSHFYLSRVNLTASFSATVKFARNSSNK